MNPCKLSIVLGSVVATTLSSLQAADSLSDLVHTTEAVKVAGGFRFTEGPVSDAEGNLYFSDIPAHTIYKFSAEGRLSVHNGESGNSNGLRLDADGRLLACEHGGRRVSATDLETGESETLIAQYQGAQLNSPNDLWIDPDGGLYFTDPRYGSRDTVEQDGFHVYYLPAGANEAIRVVDDMVMPNGIIGDSESDILYITDNGGGQTYRYRRNEDGTLSDKTPFAPYGGDGMTLDEQGNLYITVDGVRVFSPQGDELGMIASAERPANVTFGGVDGKTLFITARTSLYAIRMTVRGQ